MMISLIQSLSEIQYVCINLILQIYALCDKVSHVFLGPHLYRTSQLIYSSIFSAKSEIFT